MEKSKIPPFFLLFIIILAVLTINSLAHASSSLNLTVTTDKASYYIEEYVYVYGNLTLDETPVQDGLVGLEVNNPHRVIVVRTLNTNMTPAQNWLVEVINVTPCDQYGNPQESFPKKNLAYFNVTVRNNDIEMRQVLAVVNVYDTSQAPLGVASFKGTLKENTTISIIMSVPIPETAETGNATAYANAYSDWPGRGGKPYCPERSKTFEITNGITGASSTTVEEQVVGGNYVTTFKLSREEPTGMYTVHVTSIYQGLPAINSTTFTVKVPGDANGDGLVETKDLIMLGRAWDTSVEKPHNDLLNTDYDPNCDFNIDTLIETIDLIILGRYWGYPSL